MGRTLCRREFVTTQSDNSAIKRRYAIQVNRHRLKLYLESFDSGVVDKVEFIQLPIY